MNLSKYVGIGEVYRVASQIKLIELLAAKHDFKRIFEYPMDPIAAMFKKPWIQVSDPCCQGDLLFTWKAFPQVIQAMKRFQGPYLLFIATNKWNLGAYLQKLYWHQKEVYASIHDLWFQVIFQGFQVVDAGYYDCPPWPDAPLSSDDSRHLGLKDSWIQNLLAFERLPGKFFRAHHVYCLARLM